MQMGIVPCAQMPHLALSFLCVSVEVYVVVFYLSQVTQNFVNL